MGSEKVLFVDLETTGLINGFTEIMEIGVLFVELLIDTHTGEVSYKIIDKFESLMKPNRMPSDYIQDYTGITLEMLKDAPSPNRVRAEFLEWWGTVLDGFQFEVIGQNFGGFDSHFLRIWLDKQFDAIFDYHSNDIWTLARNLKRKGIIGDDVDLSLDSLTAEFDITHQTHRGLGDCYAGVEVYCKLINLF